MHLYACITTVQRPFTRQSIIAIAVAMAAALLLLMGEAAGQLVTKGPLVVEMSRTFGPLTFTSDLLVPTHLEEPPDNSDRLFLTAGNGKVRILQDGALSTFLDISSTTSVPDKVTLTGANGLLGSAFHPDFADPLSPGYRKFYTFHSPRIADVNPTAPIDFAAPAGSGNITHHNILTEWTVDANNPNQIDMSSRRELFRAEHVNGNHFGGMVDFGPDGYLYTAIGQPPQSNILNAQNPSSFFGKIFRIDPLNPALTPGSQDAVSANGQYRLPASNPYVGTTGLDEVFAIGVRNPYRFSVDPVSGLVFAGDVGEGAREEVSVFSGGANLGWPHREGSLPYPSFPDPTPAPDFLAPIAEYSHLDGRSVIGGYVYHGSIPDLQGKYIFGEFSFGTGPFSGSAGRLFWIDPFNADGSLKDPSEVEIHEFRLGPMTRANSLNAPADADKLDFTLYAFGVDVEGELYAIGTRTGTNRAMGYKITSVISLDGDFNNDGRVDGADLTVWKSNFGMTGADFEDGDSDGDGNVDGNDFLAWQRTVGLDHSPPAALAIVPEPATFASLALAAMAMAVSRRAGRVRRP